MKVSEGLGKLTMIMQAKHPLPWDPSNTTPPVQPFRLQKLNRVAHLNVHVEDLLYRRGKGC
jgi:hypothetical protein